VALACVAFVSGIVRVPVALARPPGHSLRIGILTNVPGAFDPESNPFAREFVAGLNDLGYTPGRDIVLDYKTANGDSAVLPLLAAELANSKPDMLVTTAAPATLAAAKRDKNRADHHGRRPGCRRDRAGREPRASGRQHHRLGD
jgi:ABC-type uncharacterized transport system substrate-binding protein